MINRNLDQIMAYSIFRVIELCYQQGVTTTWQDIWLFLRIPRVLWSDDVDLDERIVIRNDEELELMRSLLIERFTEH